LRNVKRTFLAALLAFAAFAFARADEGAYESLIGMAQAAKTDRGPDAGPAPDPASAGAKPRRAGAVPAAPVDVEAGLKDAVAQPPAPKPRLLTRLYATLMPSWRRVSSPRDPSEPAVSTGTARVLLPMSALMPPPDSEAVKAGERRGMAELLSASAAPAACR
jgi:hypothetical protein